MFEACMGGCKQLPKYIMKNGNQWCSAHPINCSVIAKWRAKNISKTKLMQARLGLNPMQDPRICKKNHSKKRNMRAANSLRKLGKLGLLPQQIESPRLKEKRRRRVSKALSNLSAEGRLNHQMESKLKRKRRYSRISLTLRKLAREKKLPIQNMTPGEKEIFSRKLSISLKKGVAEGRVKPNLGGFKTPYLTKSGKSIIMRSGWEAVVAKLLDKLGFDWVYEPFYVPYYDTVRKMMSNTLPDFYVPKLNLMIEVKGASIGFKKTRDKLRWIRKAGYNVVLIGRKEINDIRNNEFSLILAKFYGDNYYA